MATPELKVNGDPVLDMQPAVKNFGEPNDAPAERPRAARNDTNYSKFSMMSVPPEGSILTGKQEHCRLQSYS